MLHFTKPPLVVQRQLFGALEVIARALGYKGSYPKYTDASGPDLSCAKGAGAPSTARVLAGVSAGVLAPAALLLLASLLLLRWRTEPPDYRSYSPEECVEGAFSELGVHRVPTGLCVLGLVASWVL